MRPCTRALVHPFPVVQFRDFCACGPREDSESSSAAARASGGGAPRAKEKERSTLVLVDRLDITEDGDLLLVRIEGSHFLWKMVRRIVGVLVEVGRGALQPADAAAFLAEASEVPARLTAPSSGLFLARVYYSGDVREDRISAATPLHPSKVKT